MKESLFTSEQNVTDWIADRYSDYREAGDTTREGAMEALARRIEMVLYFATGYDFMVRPSLPKKAA